MKKLTTMLLSTVAITALLSSDAMAAKSKKHKKHAKKSAHAVECQSKVSMPATAAAMPAAGSSANTDMSGAFVGVSLGAASTVVTNQFALQSNATQKMDTFSGKVSPYYGALVGYNHQMGSALLGAELNVGYDTNAFNLYEDHSTSNDYPTLSLKKGLSFGFAARVGVLLNASTNLYVKLGLDRVKYTLKAIGSSASSSSAVVNNSLSVNKSGFVFTPGLGLETFVNSNLFARLEYSYAAPKTVRISNGNALYGSTAVGNNVFDNAKVSQHLVKLSVGYKF